MSVLLLLPHLNICCYTMKPSPSFLPQMEYMKIFNWCIILCKYGDKQYDHRYINSPEQAVVAAFLHLNSVAWNRPSLLQGSS